MRTQSIWGNITCAVYLLISAMDVCAAPDAKWINLPNSTHNGLLNPAVVYDPSHSRIVMIGGGYYFQNPGSSSGSQYFSNEVWQFTVLGGWLRLNPETNTPAGQLRPRVYPNACYDPTVNKVIIGGGTANWDYVDTYSLTGSTLSHLTDSLPSGNTGKCFFFNTHINAVCYVHYTGQIYQLQGGTWVSLNVGLPLNWGEANYGRFGFAYSYNPSTEKLLVFGGFRQDDQPTSETYMWNAITQQWSQLNTASSPLPRVGASMVYSSALGKHILAGGEQHWGADLLSDVWEFDEAGGTWLQLTVENPRECSAHRLVYDNSSGKVYSVGGWTTSYTYGHL